jgi:lipoprotein-anchoring transpeptidase ErfK/SrfK
MKHFGLVLSVAVCISGAPAVAQNAKLQPQKVTVLGAMSGSEDFAILNQSQSFSNDDGVRSRQLVAFATKLSPGSVLIKTHERKLYFVLPSGQAYQYPVGVGREGYTWHGQNKITRKSEWPDWRPPAVMISREAKKGHMLPDIMEGGTDNPLGARALYIGSTEYRIHGTTQPWSIGRAVSSGCIRMLNEHVIDLYDRVGVGATVVVEG